jgi:membrane-associated PAP2 superfamily phosphatase
MNSPPTTASLANDWKKPLLILAVIAALSTPVFWFTDVDIQAAALFYQPTSAGDLWPGEFDPLWRFFYYGAPLFAGLLGVGAFAVLLLGLAKKNWLKWRRHAAFVLLTLALGPGLVVNVIFKDNWGRPRPRQIEVFQGNAPYLPPLAMGENNDGKSFPAGHASVGFSFFVLWFLWRRRHRLLAWGGLIGASLLGLLMGLGRMAAGAHFLSDVLWAGYLLFLVALINYYFILRIPQQEARANSAPSAQDNAPNHLATAAYGLLATLLLIGSLMSYPVNETIDYRPKPEHLPLAPIVRLELDKADVEISIHDDYKAPLHISGGIRGFGLPTYKIDSRGRLYQEETPKLEYTLKQRGFFIELATRLKVELNATQIQRLEVNLRKGDIKLSHDGASALPVLDIRTAQGRLIGLDTPKNGRLSVAGDQHENDQLPLHTPAKPD